MEYQLLYKNIKQVNGAEKRKNEQKMSRNRNRHDNFSTLRNLGDLDSTDENIVVSESLNLKPSMPTENSSRIFSTQMEEKIHKMKIARQKRAQKEARTLTEINNRPPFITAVPVGRLVPKDNDFVFQFKKSEIDKKKDQQRKKRKSLHRPPFILSTRRPSIISIDNVPRLVGSSLKKNHIRSGAPKQPVVPKRSPKTNAAKKNILKKLNNASIAQKLREKLELEWIMPTPALPRAELTFNVNCAVATSTVQKIPAARKPPANNQNKNRLSTEDLSFMDGISPIEAPAQAKEPEVALNTTFTEEDPLAMSEKRPVIRVKNERVSTRIIFATSPVNAEVEAEVAPTTSKYPDSIIKHRASKRSRCIPIGDEEYLNVTAISTPQEDVATKRRTVKFSMVPQITSPPEQQQADSVEFIEENPSQQSMDNLIKRRSRKSSVRSSQISETPTLTSAVETVVVQMVKSPQLEEAQSLSVDEVSANKRKKPLKRQKVIVIDDSPDPEVEVPIMVKPTVAKRNIFEGVTPVNKNIDKLKSHASKRRSLSVNDLIQLETPPQNVQVSALVTPALNGDSATKRRRTLKAEKREKSANYYYNMLESVISQLRESAQIWLDYKEERGDELPTVAKDMIDSATGQTNLLITKKFEQFRKLVGLYDRGAVGGERKVFSDDLDGFWSMTHMQVDNLNDRFAELQKFKDNEWVDPTSRKRQRNKPKLISVSSEEDVGNKAKKQHKKKAVTKSSGLLDFIRKTRMQQKTSGSSTESCDVMISGSGSSPRANDIANSEASVPVTPSRLSRRVTMTPRRRSHTCTGCTPQSRSNRRMTMAQRNLEQE